MSVASGTITEYIYFHISKIIEKISDHINLTISIQLPHRLLHNNVAARHRIGFFQYTGHWDISTGRFHMAERHKSSRLTRLSTVAGSHTPTCRVERYLFGHTCVDKDLRLDQKYNLFLLCPLSI